MLNTHARLPLQAVKDFLVRNYMKNRATISKDIPTIFDDMDKVSGLTMIRHTFNTGEDYGTWIVPPSWDIKDAWLKGPQGQLLGSLKEHPLFVSAYSCSVHTKVSKADLLKHITSEARQPDAFAYNWRYTCDANLRMKDWGISLPKNRVDALPEGEYEIFIDVDSRNSQMIVGEYILPGREEKAVMFLANYCHSGQVNDSFSGLGMFMKVMHDLALRKDRRYTYRFLIMQETVGSAIYVSRFYDELKKNLIGAIFSEMVGWGDEWYIKQSRTATSYLDNLAQACVHRFGDVKLSPFFSVYGNDELIFDSVQVGIPALSVQKFPFVEYHTSLDEPSRIKDADLQRACDMVEEMVDILEQDKVYVFTGPVPFWMTRFKLYSDDTYEREDFLFKFDVVYKLLDGKRSVLDIANVLVAPFKKVLVFIQAMERQGLVKVINDKPWQKNGDAL